MSMNKLTVGTLLLYGSADPEIPFLKTKKHINFNQFNEYTCLYDFLLKKIT